MHNLLEQETTSSATTPRKQFASILYWFLYPLSWIMIIVALLSGIVLLVSDVRRTMLPHPPISAAPLLLVGAAYLAFQVLIQSKPLDLFKALIVSSAFILWGVDQLLPAGWFATTLGDVVIVLYVIDLSWMMIDRLKQRW